MFFLLPFLKLLNIYVNLCHTHFRSILIWKRDVVCFEEVCKIGAKSSLLEYVDNFLVPEPCVCMCVCIYIYMCVYAYTQACTQTLYFPFLHKKRKVSFCIRERSLINTNQYFPSF